MNRPARGRLAPSPTGAMHVGNASSALLAWWSVRAAAGEIVLRMEDLDRARCRAEFDALLIEDLRWLGLDWDAGPVRQSERQPLYDAAFARLRERDRVYPCFCSRRDIAAAAGAPQEPGEERRYPGTCRGLPAEEALSRVAAGERHAWRFRVDGDRWPGFVDLRHGVWSSGATPGDFVVQRSDGATAYQLAVVVDDADQAIGEVVRGDDLLTSTARQLLLYEALELEPPAFAHVPLILDAEGVRLSKRQRGITLRELRDDGWSPERLVGKLAALLGLAGDDTPRTAGELVEGFDWARLAPGSRSWPPA